MAKRFTQIKTYFVQAILGDEFEDLYVEASSYAEAVSKARKLTRLQSRWTSFAF